MFPNWQSLPKTFKYVFGGPDGSSDTGTWRIPPDLADVEIARRLASKVERYQRDDYLYRANRIEHPYYPDLVIMTASIQGLDGFQNNTGDEFTDSTSGSCVLQNITGYDATFEWRNKPRNRWKLKHAFFRNSMEGNFQELPGSIIEAHPKGTNPIHGDPSRKPLPTGQPAVMREKSVQVIYDFVPENLYDEDHLQDIQAKINLDANLFGRGKGCVLYINSEKEDILDSLGTWGYQVTHNFLIRPRDFNIVDGIPVTGSTTREDAEKMMVLKDLDASDGTRPYGYHAMKADREGFRHRRGRAVLRQPAADHHFVEPI